MAPEALILVDKIFAIKDPAQGALGGGVWKKKEKKKERYLQWKINLHETKQ